MHKEIPEDFKSPDAVRRRGKLKFTIGLPRCGKSSYCTAWSQYLVDEPNFYLETYYPRAIVCADNIRLALHGHRFNGYAEPMVGAMKDYMVEALLSRGHDVIIDGTHTTPTSIRKVLEIEPTAEPVMFHVHKEVCIQRALETNQADLVPVIDRMYKQFRMLIIMGIDTMIDNIRQSLENSKKVIT